MANFDNNSWQPAWLRLVYSVLAVFLVAACSSSGNEGGQGGPPPPAQNSAPIAQAGTDLNVSTTVAVALDGSGSTDADGDALTYAWSITAMPGGSQSALDDDTLAQPSFTPDVAGNYTIELVVSDGTDSSTADPVNVMATDNTITLSIGPAGGTLTSSDGLLTLTIPPGALAVAEDLSITVVPVDQQAGYLGPEFDAVQNIETVYDLGPNAMTFAIPVVATATGIGNPVVDATTMSGPAPFLLTSDGSNIEWFEDIELIADADAASMTLSGTLDHFSPAVLGNFRSDLIPFVWTVTGVPDRVEPMESVTMTATIDPTDSNVASSIYTDTDIDPQFTPAGGPITNAPLGPVVGSDELSRNVVYRCDSTGTTTYRARIEINMSADQPEDARHFAGQRWAVYPTKRITCDSAPPGGVARLTPGLNAMPAGITNPETVQVGTLLDEVILQPLTDVSDKPFAFFSGREGSVLYDIQAQATMHDRTDPARTDPLFGAVFASSRYGASGRSGMIYEHGPGSFGGIRCDWDELARIISSFCQTKSGTGYDASTIGNTHSTDEVVFVTSTSLGKIVLDTITGLYDYRDYQAAPGDFLGGTPISGAAPVSSDQFFVVTQISTSSEVFIVRELAPPEIVTTFFDEDARKIRCTDSLCGISIFEDLAGNGLLRFIMSDGLNAPTVVDTPIQVGLGPVGIDPMPLPDGNVLWLSTGFNDGTVTLTETTNAGAEVSSNTASVPAGCLNPGHGVFYKPTTNPEEAQVVGTCFGSNQWFALDIEDDPVLGFVTIDLP